MLLVLPTGQLKCGLQKWLAWGKPPAPFPCLSFLFLTLTYYPFLTWKYCSSWEWNRVQESTGKRGTWLFLPPVILQHPTALVSPELLFWLLTLPIPRVSLGWDEGAVDPRGHVSSSLISCYGQANSEAKLRKLILTSIFKYFYNVPFNLILHL